MAINYIKQFEDGSTVATDVAPTYGSVSAVGDYYLNGLWYDNTGTVYDPQFTYASKDGKLLGVEIADGKPVDLHYDEYAPTLVEDTIQATNIISNNFVGKNACTAWVNFDGTTTPPTIRDSFNVSDVVKVGNGAYEIYFDSMDNGNYSVQAIFNYTGNHDIYVAPYQEGIYKSSEKVRVQAISSSAGYNPASLSIQIFGGKN